MLSTSVFSEITQTKWNDYWFNGSLSNCSRVQVRANVLRTNGFARTSHTSIFNRWFYISQLIQYRNLVRHGTGGSNVLTSYRLACLPASVSRSRPGFEFLLLVRTFSPKAQAKTTNASEVIQCLNDGYSGRTRGIDDMLHRRLPSTDSNHPVPLPITSQTPRFLAMKRLLNGPIKHHIVLTTANTIMIQDPATASLSCGNPLAG